MFSKKQDDGEAHGERVFLCPRCGLKMDKLKKDNILLDVCNKCKGMWLDSGEIGKVAEIYIQAQKSEQPTESSKK